MNEAATELNGRSIEGRRGRSYQSVLFYAIKLAGFVPAMVALLVVFFYGINAPFLDDFEIGHLIYKFQIQGIGWNDLIGQHNESRKFFPRLIYLLLAMDGEWNLTRQMWVTWCVLLATQLTLSKIVSVYVSGYRRDLLMLPVAILLFSIAQWQNMLWGIQMVVFVPFLALVLSMAAICFVRGEKYLRAVLVAILAIATFSYANGMIVFPLVCVALVYRVFSDGGGYKSILTAGTYVACGVMLIGYYFWGYVKPGAHPSFYLVLERPVDAWLYFTSFVGNGLRFSLKPVTNVVVGHVGILYVCCLLGFIFGSREVRRRLGGRLGGKEGDVMGGKLGGAVLWAVLIGVYSVVSGVILTLGRLGFGTYGGISDRYVTFALPFWMSAVLLSYVCYWIYKDRLKASRLFLIGPLAVVVVIGLGWQKNLNDARRFAHEHHKRKVAIHFIEQMDGESRKNIGQLLYPDLKILKDRLSELRAKKLWRNDDIKLSTGAGELGRAAEAREGGEDGGFVLDSISVMGDETVLAGRAMDVETMQPYVGVVATYKSGGDEQMVFSWNTSASKRRPGEPFSGAAIQDGNGRPLCIWMVTLPKAGGMDEASDVRLQFIAQRNDGYRLVGPFVVKVK